ncbi:MAG TPA: adenosine-specific kinase [bacterium]|nr:adenosine-specific kinase [bacterium]
MDLTTVTIEKPEEMNFILGHAHFIKTVEDIQELMANINPSIEYGLAFAEASGPCLIRKAGNKPELVDLAVKNIQAIGVGHSFILFLGNAFPINILPELKQVREICTVYAATANPCEVIVAESEQGRGIVGVIDGFSPKGVETDEDIQKRKVFLRMIGYKQ